jgi:hypothetical protein
MEEEGRMDKRKRKKEWINERGKKNGSMKEDGRMDKWKRKEVWIMEEEERMKK